MTTFLRIVRRRRPLSPLAPPEIFNRASRPDADPLTLMARMGSTPHPRLTAKARPQEGNEP
jgi:hypothetical protein